MSDEAISRPQVRARSGRRLAVTATTVLVLAGAGVAAAEWRRILPAGTPATNGSATDNGSPTALATATSQDLTAQQQVNGTLGYTGSYQVVNHAQGTLTTLPSVGQVISQGQTLYQVDGKPVVLLYGAAPLYRDLSIVDTGPDVLEVNTALGALGYSVTKSDTFDWRTRAAVEELQAAMGVTQDGVLHQNQVVMLPGQLRVTSVTGTLGGQAGPTVVQASSTSRQVVVALDATQQGNIKVGDKVTITLPGNQTTTGVVSTVGTVATTPSGQNGSPTVEVDITPTDPTATGSLDQAPVQVSITTASAPPALLVPVNALLALTNGGYAVEVVTAGGAHKLVAVSLGLFDDAAGLVQVTDTTLQAGDRVVVAGS